MVTTEKTVPPAMLIDTREAARLLSISPRTLWQLTKQKQVPAVRIGRSVRYRVVDLENWTRSTNIQGA
jgi:excisionase family DNA binding protein